MLESEPLRKEDERRMFVAEMSWLRRIIGRNIREKVRNEQTREELGAQETVLQKIKKRRLQWFGHVERLEGKRLPNAALHGQWTCRRKEKQRDSEEDLDGHWTMSGKTEREKYRLDQDW